MTRWSNMMRFLRHFLPQSIVGQITGVIVAAALLGVGLTSAVFVLFFERESRANADLIAAAQAARIAAIVKQAETDSSSPELTRMMSAVRWVGMDVEKVEIARLAPAPTADPASSTFLNSILKTLKETWRITPLTGAKYPAGKDALTFKVSDNSAIVVKDISKRMLVELVFVPMIYAFSSITLIMLFFSVYGVRWITSPLSAVAAAAHSFARSPAEPIMVSEEGPREIAELAAVLNDTARRVHSLMDERTRMLAAISHDLRTPLTRLRLRAERLGDAKTRDSMLDDITAISDMLNQTLAFMRNGDRQEPVRLVDLSSLLQTICAQFADVGHSVSYQGPGRFAFACRARALTRAVTNIVDNGVKNGTFVTVTLQALEGDAAQIEISDDGPGIPVAIQGKVFDTFFKGDSARPSSRTGGFGLGLSIARDIVRKHGGEISLSNHEPHGLKVRMALKAGCAESPPATAGPADPNHSNNA